MLRPQNSPIVPDETRRVARAAFPKGTLCLRIAEALGPVYQDRQFTALFPSHGQPAAAPGRLALAVVLQFMENLSDREAADAVRGRIDWKYARGTVKLSGVWLGGAGVVRTSVPDDDAPRPALRGLSRPGRDHQRCGLAVCPVPVKPAHGRRKAGGSRPFGHLPDGPAVRPETRPGMRQPHASASAPRADHRQAPPLRCGQA